MEDNILKTIDINKIVEFLMNLREMWLNEEIQLLDYHDVLSEIEGNVRMYQGEIEEALLAEEEKDWYPLQYNQKTYHEKDCSPLFRAFYYGADTLRDDGSVYIGDGLSVYPDGATTNQ